jgi:hypothetical protein
MTFHPQILRKSRKTSSNRLKRKLENLLVDVLKVVCVLRNAKNEFAFCARPARRSIVAKAEGRKLLRALRIAFIPQGKI